MQQDEYPSMVNIHTKCISMIAHMWHAPTANNAIGTATTGSSEAIQLGGLALKKVWQAKMKAKGKDIHNPGPNIVMGANAVRDRLPPATTTLIRNAASRLGKVRALL